MATAITVSTPFAAHWRRLFRDWGGRLWLFSLVVLAALLAADLSVPVDSRLHLLLVDALLPLLDVIAVVLALRASRTSRLDAPTRFAWGRLAFAFSLFLAGDIAYELRGVLDPASAAAPGVLIPYFLFYPAFLWAVLSFPGVVRGGDEGRKFWLDAASVIIGGGMPLWHWVMAPALTRAFAGEPLRMLPLSYPLGDLMHLAAFSTVVLRQPRNPVFKTLAAAILLGLASDVVYGVELLAGSVTAGGISDVLLALQWVLYAGAAHLQFEQGPAPAPAPAALAPLPRQLASPLPHLALGIGYFTLLVAAWSSPRGSLIVLAALATLLSGVVAVRQLISARENAQLEAAQAKRRSQARFEALVESSADVIALLGADATFRYVSGAVEGALGRGRQELIGRSLFEFMHPDDVAHCERVLGRALASSGVHCHSEFRFRHADGLWRQLEADGVNRLEDPDIQGIVATFRDVTARRESERELRESEERFRALASSLLAAEVELRGRKELSENLLAVARATTEHPSLETTLRNALTVMKRLVAAEGGSVLLVDEPGRLQGRVYADGDPCLLVDPQGVELIMSDGLAGWVARHREAALVADTLNDERWLSLATEPIRSALCVPIASGAQLVGILTLVHSQTGHFTDGHLELARAAAEQIALALRNAQVFDVVGRMASRQRLLNDVLRTATGRADPGTVLSSAVELIARRTRWLSVALSVPEAGRWRIRASAEELARIPEQPLADGVVGRAYKTGETQLVPDVSLDPDYVSASPLIKSEMAVPLRRGERILGVMNVESDVKNAFDEDDVRLAGALADTVALALEEAELYRGLADESDRLGAVIESSRDGILLLGQDGKILVVNEPALRLLGRVGEPAAWLGESAGAAGLPTELAVGSAAAEGETRLGASVVTWRRQAVAAGPSIGQLVVLRDVTDARRAENLREELTHTLVHDLRSPLNSIMGFLEILEQAPSLPGSQQELLSIARRATKRLVSLVDTILDVSRLEKGALPLEPAPVRVAQLAAEVLDLQKPVAQHRGVALRNEVPSELPEAWADPSLLLRILENLVSNALRHTPRGGKVRVGARSEPGGGLRLSVTDTGGGIPDFEQKHVFEKFVTGARGGPRGTGLGLAFCRLAVEAHGGRIWIESEPDRGATFFLTLPPRAES